MNFHPIYLVFFLIFEKKAMDSYLLMYHEFQNSSLILWYNRFTMELSYFRFELYPKQVR